MSNLWIQRLYFQQQSVVRQSCLGWDSSNLSTVSVRLCLRNDKLCQFATPCETPQPIDFRPRLETLMKTGQTLRDQLLNPHTEVRLPPPDVKCSACSSNQPSKSIQTFLAPGRYLRRFTPIPMCLIRRRSESLPGHGRWSGITRQLTKPGDFFTTELLGEPLLLVRGAQGELRGFYNVCRHRAGPPAEGCGSRKLFRCGYHGWTYGLDGALISAPEFEGQPGFDANEFALAPVRAEEWFNLIFVNFDSSAEPLHKKHGSASRAGRTVWFHGNEIV